MQAGDHIITAGGDCTAAYGAYEHRTERSTGDDVRARFVLTAAHCASLNATVVRSDKPIAGPFYEVGTVNRVANASGAFRLDGEAIRIKGGLAPNTIFRNGLRPLPVGNPAQAHHNEPICISGVGSNEKRCGKVVGEFAAPGGGYTEIVYLAKLDSVDGDSGSPAWNPTTGMSIGIVEGEPEGHPQYCVIVPLIKTPREPSSRSPGVLKALSLPNPPRLQLIVGH